MRSPYRLLFLVLSILVLASTGYAWQAQPEPVSPAPAPQPASTTTEAQPAPEPTPVEPEVPPAQTETAEPAAAAPAEESGMAEVHVYRPKSIMGMALHPTLMLDGADLVNIANGTVWEGEFKPGHYAFLMDDKKTGAELDLEAGKSYYMKIEITPGLWKGGGKLTLMTPEQGETESKGLKPLPTDEIEHPMFKKPATK